jgi:hypothetical protein
MPRRFAEGVAASDDAHASTGCRHGIDTAAAHDRRHDSRNHSGNHRDLHRGAGGLARAATDPEADGLRTGDDGNSRHRHCAEPSRAGVHDDNLDVSRRPTLDDDGHDVDICTGNDHDHLALALVDVADAPAQPSRWLISPPCGPEDHAE